VQTLRFTQQIRVERDNRISISTEHIVDSPEDAQEAGATSAELVAAFINGYGNADTSIWQPDLEVE
jgi:hypothetical protein